MVVPAISPKTIHQKNDFLFQKRIVKPTENGNVIQTKPVISYKWMASDAEIGRLAIQASPI